MRFTKVLGISGLSWLTLLCNITWTSGVLWSADWGGGSAFQEKEQEGVLQLQGYHTLQPPFKGLYQGAGEEIQFAS